MVDVKPRELMYKLANQISEYVRVLLEQECNLWTHNASEIGEDTASAFLSECRCMGLLDDLDHQKGK